MPPRSLSGKSSTPSPGRPERPLSSAGAAWRWMPSCSAAWPAGPARVEGLGRTSPGASLEKSQTEAG